INEFMQNNNDVFHVMNVFLPLGGKLEALDVYNNEKKVNGVLDLFSQKIEESLSKGPAAIYELFDDIKACRGNGAIRPQPADQRTLSPHGGPPPRVRNPRLGACPLRELEGDALMEGGLASGHTPPEGDRQVGEQMEDLLENVETAFQDMA